MSNLSNEKDKILAAADQIGSDLQSLDDDLLAPVAGGRNGGTSQIPPRPGDGINTCGGLNEGSFRPSDGIGVGEINARGRDKHVKR